jgi:hypothetical protein
MEDPAVPQGTRIFREKPFGWWDKPTMRYLRDKYGKDKKRFCALRSVYLALCEIDSDFVDRPINSLTKTLGTYAGTSRQVAGRYIRLLEKEGLIRKVRLRDPKTKSFARGSIIEILSVDPAKLADLEPLAGYPTNGVSHRKETRPSIKKISMGKKKRIDNNVVQKGRSEQADRADYYAGLIADTLGDPASISFFKAACRRHDGAKLLQKATEIVKDGGARKPAAVFTAWLQGTSQA